MDLVPGRCDIGCGVMSMSSHHVAPRQGHLERLKRICGCLMKMQHFGIRFRTHEPDFSNLKTVEQDWFSVHRDVSEDLSVDASGPLGKSVQLVHHVDANLMHDCLTGRSVTACLHFVNTTPIN